MPFTLTIKFEELPGFHYGEMSAGSFNGEAEVTFDEDAEWEITRISIDCDNGKLGAEAKGERVELSQQHHNALYFGLYQSLRTRHKDHIEDEFVKALDQQNVRVAFFNARHRGHVEGFYR
jgi:hypothetical protein